MIAAGTDQETDQILCEYEDSDDTCRPISTNLTDVCTRADRNANREAAIGRKVLLVNHKLDNRHDTCGLSTHTDKKQTDTSKFKTISVSNLESLIIGREESLCWSSGI